MAESPAKRKRSRARVWLRRLGVLAVLLASVALVAATLGWLWLQSDAGNRWIRNRVVGIVNGGLAHGHLKIDDLQTNLFTHLVLTGVALDTDTGHEVVGANRLELRYGVLGLLRRRFRVDSLDADGLVLDVDVAANGTSSFTTLFGPSNPNAPPSEWNGLPVDVRLDALDIRHARVRWATPDKAWAIHDLAISGAASAVGKRIALTDLDLEGTVTAPTSGPVEVAGSIAWDGDTASVTALDLRALQSHLVVDGGARGLRSTLALDATVALDPVDLPGVDALLGTTGLGGRWKGTLAAKGPLSALQVSGSLRGVQGTRGGLDVDATADLSSKDVPWHAVVQAHTFHAEDAWTPLAAIVPVLGTQVALDGKIVASGQGTRWPDGIQAKASFDGGTQRIYGMDFDQMGLQVALAKGVLTLGSIGTRGPIGALDGKGTLDLARGPLDLHLWGTFDAAQLGRFKADGFTGAGRLDLHFSGNSKSARPVYTTVGTVHVAHLTYLQGDVRAAEADAAVQVDVRKQGVQVRADLSGTGGDVYGITVDSLHDPQVQVDVPSSGPITVAGQVEAKKIAMPGVFRFATAHGPWHFEQPPAGNHVVQADLAVGTWSLLDLVPGTRGVGTMKLVGDDLSFGADLVDGKRTALDTAGTMQLARKTLRLKHLALSPVEGYRYVAQRPVRLRLSPYGGITDADISLAGSHGEILLIRGTLGASGPLDARIDMAGFDLGVVAALRPKTLGYLTGTAGLHATVSGRADAMTLDGRLDAQGTFLSTQTAPLAVTGTFDGAEDELQVDLSSTVGKAPLAAVHGAVPFRLALSAMAPRIDGPIDLAVDLRPGLLDRLGELTGRAVAPGRASARLVANGTLANPRVDVSAVVEARVGGWSAPMRVEIGGQRGEDADTTFWADAYEGFDRRAVVDGHAQDQVRSLVAWALGGGPAPDLSSYTAYASSVAVDAELTGFPIRSFMRLLGQHAKVDGRLAGGVKVRGSPDTPVVIGDLEWDDGHLARIAVDQGRLRLEPTDEGYHVDLGLRTGSGGLQVSGDVPVYLDLRKDPRTWVTGDLAMKVQAQQLPLAIVEAFVPEIQDAQGTLDLQGDIGGTVIDPRPVLTLSLHDGQLAYVPLGVRYRKIDLSARLTSDLARIDSLTLVTEPIRQTSAIARGTSAIGEKKGDHLALHGQVALKDWTAADVQGSAVLDGFWVSALDNQLIRVGGNLDVGGTWPKLSITGKTTVSSGFVRLDSAAFLSEGSLQLDPRLVVHRGGTAVSVKPPTGPPPVWNDFDVDVGISMSRNFELNVLFPFLTSFGQIGAALTTANMDARLGGDLDFEMHGGAYKILGEVDVVDGKVKVLRSNFDLQEGTVTFQGDPSNPFLDLTARMDVASTYIDMSVKGAAAQPSVSFASPVYSSQTQILAMLVTGQAPQNLSPEQGQTTMQFITSLLLASATSVATSVLGGAKIGTVSFDADGTVRVGLPLGRVYAEGVYRLSPKLDENHYAVDFEVNLAQKLVLDGAFGDRHSWADLFWELRF